MRYMNISNLKNYLVCKSDVDVDKITELREVDELMEAEKCASQYIESLDVMKRCIPIRLKSRWLSNLLNKDQLEVVEKFIWNLHDLKKMMSKVSEDLKLSQ